MCNEEPHVTKIIYEEMKETDIDRYGKIYKEKNLNTGNHCEIREIKKININENIDFKNREVFNSEYIVQYKYHFLIEEKKEYIYIEMDYEKGKLLQEFIDERIKNNLFINEEIIFKIFFQLSYLMKYLHYKNFIENNIIPKNIKIDEKK